ncbi:synaptotagmin-1-like [Tubulanus polymorphus]|uniref:synaptotagmin-1-like n=1 Tax=Tubulanus polymorphus TaxID=672921 RepID=UPI003DA54B67
MNGPMIGLIAGACVGGLLLILIAVIMIFRAMKRKKRRDSLLKDGVHTGDVNGLKRFSSDPDMSHSSSSGGGKYRSMAGPSLAAQPGRVTGRTSGQPMPPLRGSIVYASSAASDSGLGYGGIATQSSSSTSEDDIESDEGSGDQGKIWFTVVYDSAQEILNVEVIKAKYSQGRDKNPTPRDPFVKVFLLPDEMNSHQTKTQKKTLYPKFNEAFSFKVTTEELDNRIVRLSVYDLDARSIRHCEGHALYPLENADVTSADPICKDLNSCSNATSFGQIYFSLTHMPSTEKVKVVVLRGRGLNKSVTEDGIFVYVKVQIIVGRKTLKTKKTGQQTGQNPVFNECFSFSINNKLLEQCSIVVTLIKTKSRAMGKNYDEPCGRCVVGPFMFARGELLRHWQEMLANPRTTVAKWHSLMPLPD